MSLRITRRRVLSSLSLTVLGAACFPRLAVASTKTGKIGVLVQLTGSSATYGIGVQHGIEIAKQELKDKGVIDLEIFYEDHQQQPQLAVQGFQKLVDVHGVRIVMANSSPINLALNPFAKEREVLIYNYNAVS